jgi:hypothetical protein
MSAEYDREWDLERCCGCSNCVITRAHKGIKEPSETLMKEARDRLHRDDLKRAQAASTGDVMALLDRLRDLSRIDEAAVKVGVGRSLSEAFADALKNGAPASYQEPARVPVTPPPGDFGRTFRAAMFDAVQGKVPPPTPKLDAGDAFDKLYDALLAEEDWTSDNEKSIALMRIREAQLMWEDK